MADASTLADPFATPAAMPAPAAKPAAKGATPAKPAKTQDTLDDKVNALLSKAQKSIDQGDEMTQQERDDLQAQRKSISDQQANIDATNDEINKTILNMQNVSSFPREDAQAKAREIKKFAPLLLAFTALASFAGGGVATGVTALASGLKAYGQGKKDQYAAGYQVWKDKTDEALKLNQEKLQSYHDIINNQQLSLDRKTALMQATAKYYQDARMQRATDAKDYAAMATTLTQLSKAHNTFAREYYSFQGKIKPVTVSKPVRDSVSSLFTTLAGKDKLLSGMSDDDKAAFQDYWASLTAGYMQANPKTPPHDAAVATYNTAKSKGLLPVTETGFLGLGGGDTYQVGGDASPQP